MYTAVVTIHVIVCIILVLTVLLQQGKGAEVGAVFGSSETMFGSTGPASALNKLTTVVAIVFMITSLGLTYLAAHRKGDSVMENVKIQAPAASLPGTQQAEPVVPEESPAGSAASDVQGQAPQATPMSAEPSSEPPSEPIVSPEKHVEKTAPVSTTHAGQADESGGEPVSGAGE